MRYSTAGAFRDALEQRLRNQAQTTNVGLMRLRKRVAFERFLARLLIAAPERWVLKGAFALDLRLGLRTRTTKDIDIARKDDEQTATADLAAAAAVDLGDFFSYRVRRTPAFEKAMGFHAVRYTVTGDLAGRRFEQFPIDVAFTEAPPLEPDQLPAPGVLMFAGIEPPDLPVIALEQHIAEKIHAYSGTYGPAERESTRSKDLIDLLLISVLTHPDAERLKQALNSTFHNRDRQPLPASLPPPPNAWTESYAVQARAVDVAADLDAAHTQAARFIDPVLQGTATGHWNANSGEWEAEG